MLCKDKGWHNYSIYDEDGYGLTFEDFSDGKASYMTSWTLSSTEEVVHGNDIPELLNALELLLAKKGKKVYNENKKDIILIYTDRIMELYCYLYNYVGCVFPDNAFTSPLYFQVLEMVEFRPCWEEELTEAKDIAMWAKDMMDNLFIKDKVVYLTPSQISRKRIMKDCKKQEITLGQDIFPENYSRYEFIRQSLYGGICYCPYKKEVFERPIIEIDLKSAYLYCFLLRHCISKGKFVSRDRLKHWERFLDDEYKFTIGEYRITYTSWSRKYTCFKTAEGEEPGLNPDSCGVCTDTFIFDNMDIKIFLSTVNAMKVECLGLMEFDTGYIPKPYIDCVLDMFIKKEHSEGAEKDINKIAANSVYGNTARRYEDALEFKYADKTFPTQWGVYITSYCKNLLLGLATQLDGWIYSDTDSIYCFDTPENIAKIEAYNEKTRETVRRFCEENGYPFEELKNLGCFMLKNHIVKFKAWKQKQYAFKTVEGKIIVKASGCARREHTEDIFNKDKVSVGEKITGTNLIVEEHRFVKDGVEYVSETSYVQPKLVDEEWELYQGLKAMLFKGESLTDNEY